MRQGLRDKNVEEVLRRYARDNQDLITEDNLLVAFSKLNQNFYMGEIRDFTQIVKEQKKHVGSQKPG